MLDQLKVLHSEICQFGLGFFNEVTVLNTDLNSNRLEIQAADSTGEMPVLIVNLMQAKDNPAPRLLVRIVNQQSNQSFCDIELQHGTCIMFSGNCHQKFAIEVLKKPEASLRRLLLIFRQYEITDFAKVGKTPSFGGINLKPANIFKQKDFLHQQDNFLLPNTLLAPLQGFADSNYFNNLSFKQMLAGGHGDMELATACRERALSSSQAALPIPTFKQQADESSFNKLLISKIHEIVKSNPLTKVGDKSKFSANSINNMKSPMSGNSPRNQVDAQSTTSKAQNIMNIFKMLGEKKNSPTIIKPDLSQNMNNMLSTL